VAALALAGRGGGYFIADWGQACVALVALCAAVALAVGFVKVSALGAMAAGGWMLLGVVQIASGQWAPDANLAARVGGLTLLYAAALAIVVIVTSRDARRADWAVGLSLVAAAVICGWGVLARLVPALNLGDDVSRLSVPISYWNGLGGVSAFAAVLGLGVAGAMARRPLFIVLAAAVVPVASVAVLFAVSRGSIVAAAAGLVAVVALAPDRLRMGSTVVVVLCATAPVVIAINGSSLVSIGDALPEHARSGVIALGALAASCLVAGLLAWAVAALGERIPQGVRRATGRGCAAAIALVMVAGVGAGLAGAGPVATLDDRFEAFRQYAPNARDEAVSLSDRLASSAGSGRWQNWSVAAAQLRDAPLTGDGAASFAVEWDQARTVPLDVTNAHSLYLEIVGETGVIGLVLILVPLVCAGVAVGRLRRGGDAAAAGMAAAAGSAALTLWLHAAGDWDWQLPAVMLPAVVVTGALVGRAPSTASATRGVRGSLAGLIGVAVLTMILSVPAGLAGDSAAREARAAARAGDLTVAADHARRATEREPSAAAWQLRANVLADLGRANAADAAFVEAMRRAPRDWSIPADWAAVLLRRGNGAAAAPLVARAARLNPLEPRVAALKAQVAR
jgi:tetratricopeptide (TPR) repeat protein